MKKLRNIGAILLAICMLLSMSLNALRVLAAEPPNEGKITIHKYAEPETNLLPNDGSKIDPGKLDGEELEAWNALNPLPGITFKVTQMELAASQDDENPSPNAIKANNGLWYTKVAQGYEGTSNVTDEHGEVEITGLPLGVYYIEEQSNNTTFGRKSFFVSIPTSIMENGVQKNLYDVHVYPKNETINIEKELDPDSLGDNVVTWEITTNVPSDVADGQSFVIMDRLDPRLQYVGPLEVFGNNGSTGHQPINSNYYDVDYDNEGFLKITFNNTIDPGSMAELANYKDGTIIVRFNTMINIGDDTNPNLGDIENNAMVDYKNESGSEFKKGTDPENPPYVTALGIDIKKYGDGDIEKLLDGAKFKIKDENDNYLMNPDNPTQEWIVETDEFGHADIYGLTTGTYYLEEVLAPDGYNLLNAPIEIVITENPEGGTFSYKINNVDMGALDDYKLLVEIDNSSGFELPLTGGTGTMLFTFIGLLLIGSAIVIYTVSKKKKEKHA